MKKYVTIFIVVFLAFSIFSQSLFDITSIEQGTERLKAYEELVEQLIEIKNEEDDLKRLELYDKFFEEITLERPIKLEKGVVTRVIDGDTVEIEINDKIYK
ncbi:MAG: hypothetical protein WCQ84_06565, partial [Defluviitoga tunisiensis]